MQHSCGIDRDAVNRLSGEIVAFCNSREIEVERGPPACSVRAIGVEGIGMRSFTGLHGGVGVKKMKFDAWQISEIQQRSLHG